MGKGLWEQCSPPQGQVAPSRDCALCAQLTAAVDVNMSSGDTQFLRCDLVPDIELGAFPFSHLQIDNNGRSFLPGSQR